MEQTRSQPNSPVQLAFCPPEAIPLKSIYGVLLLATKTQALTFARQFSDRMYLIGTCRFDFACTAMLI
jgi:hypothetical protein